MINDFEGLRHTVSERRRYFWREKQMSMDYSRPTMVARRKGNKNIVRENHIIYQNFKYCLTNSHTHICMEYTKNKFRLGL